MLLLSMKLELVLLASTAGGWMGERVGSAAEVDGVVGAGEIGRNSLLGDDTGVLVAGLADMSNTSISVCSSKGEEPSKCEEWMLRSRAGEDGERATTSGSLSGLAGDGRCWVLTSKPSMAEPRLSVELSVEAVQTRVGRVLLASHWKPS